MTSPTEISLEELLAEPIVKQVMYRDGVSISEARALYAAVAARLEGRAACSRATPKTLASIARMGTSPYQLSRCL